MTSSKFQPALYGGLVLGVLSALPFINIVNVCCCLWVIAGGALAAFVLQNNQPMPITAGDGAGVGLLAGIIGAIVYEVIAIPISLAMGPVQSRILQRVLENARDIPENLRPLIESAGRPSGAGLVIMFVGFLFMLVVCMAFSTIGGLIGAALFKKKMPATGTDAGGSPTP
jgi:hypothetical protein